MLGFAPQTCLWSGGSLSYLILKLLVGLLTLQKDTVRAAYPRNCLFSHPRTLSVSLLAQVRCVFERRRSQPKFQVNKFYGAYLGLPKPELTCKPKLFAL